MANPDYLPNISYCSAFITYVSSCYSPNNPKR